MNTDSRHVLFVVTSQAEIGPRQRATGYEFSEVAHPHLVFVDSSAVQLTARLQFSAGPAQ